jgi:hypothetical protein
MRVSIVYRKDCPCLGAARANVDAALALVGKSYMQVELVPLETEADAHRHAMHGSPTVLIDGRDPLTASDAPTTLACRPGGAPTIPQLLDAFG